MTKAEQSLQRQEWEELLAAFHASGLSAPKWCEANGVKLYRLRYRLSQEKRDDADESGSTAWLKATVGEVFDGQELRVKIGKAVIEVTRGFDVELLAAVARVLVEAC